MKNISGKKQTGPVGKQALLGMRQRGGKTVATPVPDTHAPTLLQTIQRQVSPDAAVCTDTHASYRRLEHLVSFHDTVNHEAKEFAKGFVHTNGIESVWAVLKRGLHGTFHHVSEKHLNRYVQEFAFRLNEGNCTVDTQDRLDTLFGQMPEKVLTYKKLTGKA